MELNGADSKIGPAKIHCQVETLCQDQQELAWLSRGINLFCSIWYGCHIGRDLAQIGACLLKTLIYVVDGSVLLAFRKL